MLDIFKNAKFIWCDGMEKTVNAYADFFEKINKKTDSVYRMYITADSDYAVYINEQFCDGGQYADYSKKYKVYDELDLTKYLKDGENDVLIVGYCQNEDSSTYRVGVAGVMYTITEDGQEIAVSNENTLCRKNPYYKSGSVDKVSGQLSYSFEYDATAEETPYSKAVVMCEFDEVYPRPIKKLEIKEKCSTRCVVGGSFIEGKHTDTVGQKAQYSYLGFGERTRTGVSDAGVNFTRDAETDGIYVVYDIGREESGLVTIDIELPVDSEMIFGWGEHFEDMRPRTYVGGRNFAARIKAKAGRFKFIHPFKRSGCRYVMLQVYSESAVVHYAGITPTDYPTTADVSFNCADSLHNRIYDVSKRTLLMCMHEHYEDCPWREQALYTMDSRNQMICGYYAFKEFDFAKSSLRLMGMSLRDDSMLELCSPARVSITIPAFSAIYSVQMWEYLLFSGDKEFVAEYAPVCEKICREFIRRTEENGLIPILAEYEYWNFYEWKPGLDGTIGKTCTDDEITYDLPLAAFVSMAYDSLSKIYSYLGDSEKAEEFKNESKKLNTAAHNAFFDAERGLYYTKIGKKSGERYHLAQITQSLAVCSGICPEYELDRVLINLVENKELVTVTLSCSIYKYEAMMKRPEVWGRRVFSDIAKEYGMMLENGATTFWETAVGGDDFGYAGSLCHGWAAVPVYFYFRYIVGLYPKNPGEMSVKLPLPTRFTGIYEAETDY